MSASRSSRTLRAVRALVLFALGALVAWWIVDRSLRAPDAAETTLAPPADVQAATRAAVEPPAIEGPSSGGARAGAAVAVPHASASPASAQPPDGPRAIRGRVVESWGKPVPDLTVWLLPADLREGVRYLAPVDRPSRTTVSGTDGSFELVPVEPGTWFVGPEPSGELPSTPDERGVAPMAVRVEVSAEIDPPDVEIRVHRGLTIGGRVLEADGTPAVEGWVTARWSDAQGLRYARLRDDGSFAVGPLVPGSYELQADGGAVGAKSETVLAFAGDDGVVLRLREAGSLSGRVVDPRADAVDAAGSATARSSTTVFAVRRDVDSLTAHGAVVGSDGAYTIEAIEPGTYQLVATNQDGWIATRMGVEVAAGDATEGVDLELRRGGRLRLQQPGEPTVRVEVWQDDVRVVSSRIVELETVLVVPAGRLSVRWTLGARPERAQHVDVEPGGEASIVISE